MELLSERTEQKLSGNEGDGRVRKIKEKLKGRRKTSYKSRGWLIFNLTSRQKIMCVCFTKSCYESARKMVCAYILLLCCESVSSIYS